LFKFPSTPFPLISLSSRLSQVARPGEPLDQAMREISEKAQHS